MTTSQLTEIAVIALAAWRIAWLISHERGPFDAALKFRELFGVTHDQHGEVYEVPNTWYADGVTCIYCTSFWITLFFYSLHQFAPGPVLTFITVWLAIAAVSLVASRWIVGE